MHADHSGGVDEPEEPSVALARHEEQGDGADDGQLLALHRRHRRRADDPAQARRGAGGLRGGGGYGWMMQSKDGFSRRQALMGCATPDPWLSGGFSSPICCGAVSPMF